MLRSLMVVLALPSVVAATADVETALAADVSPSNNTPANAAAATTPVERPAEMPAAAKATSGPADS